MTRKFDLCQLCVHYPPSSCDGKACSICPAAGKEVKTNGDRIRLMDDEELAGFIVSSFCDRITEEECNGTYKKDCWECVLAWLKKEEGDSE